MTTATTDYANKASATRAAKRAMGDEKFVVKQLESGRWVFTKARKNSGGVVDHVWAFIAKNTKMERRDQVKALIAEGIDPHTVRTQAYRFYKSGGSREAWNAIEKAERERRNAKQRAQATA